MVDTIQQLLRQEEERQARTLSLIASTNHASRKVREAQSSRIADIYAEGRAGFRYYQGTGIADKVEALAEERARALFKASFANVQPYSGSPANLAVLAALLEPGDLLMGMDLSAGGHLTHGSKVSATGRFFRSVSYGVHPESHLLDYDTIEALAKQHRPKLMVAGATAYPQLIDFERMAAIAHSVGALLLADISHIAALVVGGNHPHPFPHADVVMTTTHKSLRGPRGAMILCNDEAIAKKIDRAVFPGLQGGPHLHTIAAIAVALEEAQQPSFATYSAAIVQNAVALADALKDCAFDLVTNGTANHLLLIDLTRKGITGKQAAVALEQAALITNANAIPNDPRKPMDPSGLRLGTPALTTRGLQPKEMRLLAVMITRVLERPNDTAVQADVRRAVEGLCERFPLPN